MFMYTRYLMFCLWVKKWLLVLFLSAGWVFGGSFYFRQSEELKTENEGTSDKQVVTDVKRFITIIKEIWRGDLLTHLAGIFQAPLLSQLRILTYFEYANLYLIFGQCNFRNFALLWILCPCQVWRPLFTSEL